MKKASILLVAFLSVVTLALGAFTLAPKDVAGVVASAQETTASEGLEYALITMDGEEGYEVTGVGTCTDTQIVIPNTYNDKPVISIGEFVFSNYKNLTSITIPASVIRLRWAPFDNCDALTIYCEVESKPDVGWESNWNCDDLPVVWDCNNNDVADDGNVYLVDGGIRYALSDGKATVAVQPSNLTSAYIPVCVTYKDVQYPVTAIANNAFAESNSYSPCLTSVEFEANSLIESIGETAFHSCAALESVDFGQNSALESIGNYAFYGCISLSGIKIPASVTSIGDEAFRYCSSLASVEFEGSTNLSSLGSSVFNGCGVVNAIVPIEVCDSTWNATLKSINVISGESITQGAFKNAELLESVTIGNSVMSIENEAFRKCLALKTVSFEQNGSLKSIGNYAFYDCYQIEEISLPASLESLGTHVFATQQQYDSKLATVRIEENSKLESIGNDAFYKCPITTIEFENAKNLTSIGSTAFYRSKLYAVDFSANDELESIGSRAFGDNYNLTSITIPDSVTNMGESVFLFSSCLTIYCEATEKPSGWSNDWNGGGYIVWDCNNNDVASDGNIYAIIDGVRYAMANGEAFVARQPNSIVSATIKDEVTYKDNTYVVTSISRYAFSACMVLESVEMSLTSNVTTIEEYAFVNCHKLSSITIPASLTAIKEYAFNFCESLKTVNYLGTIDQWVAVGFDVGGKPTYVAGDLQINGELVTEVIIREATEIKSGVFENCKSIEKVILPDTVTKVVYDAFVGCEGLKFMVVGNGNVAKSIETNSYYNYLGERLNTILVPTEYTTNNIPTKFPVKDKVIYEGADYVSYSKVEHKWESYTVDLENCTQNSEGVDGFVGHKCSDCGVIKGEISSMHVFDQEVISEDYLESEATCTQKAVYHYSCLCGKVGDDTFEYGETLEHIYDQQNRNYKYLVSAATCTQSAVYAYSCVCGTASDTLTFEFGEPEGHEPSTEWDFDDNQHWHECFCGEKADVADHEWNEGVVDLYPTEEDEGIMIYTCLVCERTKIETLERLPSDRPGEWEDPEFPDDPGMGEKPDDPGMGGKPSEPEFPEMGGNDNPPAPAGCGTVGFGGSNSSGGGLGGLMMLPTLAAVVLFIKKRVMKRR